MQTTMAGDKDNTKQMQVTIQRPVFQPNETKRRAAKNRDEDKEMPAAVVEMTNSSQLQANVKH
jgi:hypothetical protein